LGWIRRHSASYWRYYEWKRGLAEPEIAFLPVLCRLDAVSVDIGGNIGLYTHPMLESSRSCMVFEPLPPMAKLLREAFGRHGDRFHLEEVALSDRAGRAELRMPEGNFGYTTMEPMNELTGKVDASRIITFEVETRALDDYSLDDVSCIKIDVEGHEESVLRGARDTLLRNRPAAIIEVEERHKPGSVEAVHSFMHDLGYEGLFLHRSGLHPVADFDLARHQSEESPGDYVRNFIFLHDGSSGETRARLEAVLR
jgi:FkbM family methyltransferase